MLSPEGMTEFNKSFEVKGLHSLDGIVINTATSLEQIIENVNNNKYRGLSKIHEISDWRELEPIAIVGGGPSLKSELDNLRKYKYIMACGSVHDYLIENGIYPTWCAVCDPDPIVINYMKQRVTFCKYLIASQCDSSVFEYLRAYKPIMWHLAGDKFDHSIYGEGQICISGGCTVGTRAMVIAMGFGFYNLHLFGMDTCLDKDKHHAYDFSDPAQEKIYDEYEIAFEENGPRFMVAGYHLGQLFDIKQLMQRHANRMHITVHGDSLLSYYMDLARTRAQMYMDREKEKENGTDRRLHRIGDVPILSEVSGG